MNYLIKKRTFVVYSAGGHKYELDKLLKNFIFKERYNFTYRILEIEDKDTIYLKHPRRKIINSLINMVQSIFYLIKFKPKLIISNGADVALFMIIFGKILLRSKIIFIESFCNKNRSITGSISYYFSDLFIIHHKNQSKYYPKAIITNGGIL